MGAHGAHDTSRAFNYLLTAFVHRCADQHKGHRAMAALSLREAAQQAGVSKSTILRAVQSGRLAAGRKADRGYSIDPAELFRVYDPSTSAGNGKRDDVQPSATAVLEERVAGLQALVSELQDCIRDLNAERDRAQARADELDRRLLTNQAPHRPWWRRAIGA
jgi:excisionase family DNA binding protein